MDGDLTETELLGIAELFRLSANGPYVRGTLCAVHLVADDWLRLSVLLRAENDRRKAAHQPA